MSNRDPFPVGARVLWGDADDEYTVWSAHRKSGWRWITRGGQPFEARITNLTVVGDARVPQEVAP